MPSSHGPASRRGGGRPTLSGSEGCRILTPSCRPTRPPARPALKILPCGLEMKAHRVAAGFHLTVVPDNPHRLVIEPRVHGPVVADKMQVAEDQSLDLRRMKMR